MARFSTLACGISLLMTSGLAMAQDAEGHDAKAPDAEERTVELQPAVRNARASETTSEETYEIARTKEEVICRRQAQTGSRVTSKRICQTEAQWAAEEAESRRSTEHGQQQRALAGGD